MVGGRGSGVRGFGGSGVRGFGVRLVWVVWVVGVVLWEEVGGVVGFVRWEVGWRDTGSYRRGRFRGAGLRRGWEVV